MLRIRNYFIAFAVVFAISSAYAVIGVQDAKAQSTMGDLIKRIEALESKGAGGNVTTGARGLKIGIMMRTRFEQQSQFLINTGGSSSRGNDGIYRLNTSSLTKSSGDSKLGYRESNEFTVQRTRVYFDADVSKNVRAYVRIADNRVWGGEQNTTNGANAVSDTDQWTELNEGYVDLRNLGDLSSFLENISIRAGRWQMFYGDHRLIGHLNWTNAGRKWNGARVKWDNKKGSWIDFFATVVQEDSTGAVSGDAVSRDTEKDELFWGLYTHFKDPLGFKGIAAEPYLIIRDRSTSDRSDTGADSGEERYSAGLRLAGKKVPSLPGVDFTFEQTWQFGHVETVVQQGAAASNPIQAFAGAWGAGYTFSDVSWSPRVGYQYAFASGDEDPDNGADKTFNQLYPTGHARLGYIDFHGYQNIRAHKAMLTLKPTKKLLMKADLWFFEADEEADDWISVAGGVNRQGGDIYQNRKGTGNIDDEYGQELDITLKYKLFKNFGVVAGYSHYFAGDFMEDTNNGSDRDSDWAYLMTSLKF